MPKKPANTEAPIPYKPSPSIAEKLAANRAGNITGRQRLPLVIAGVITSLGLICPATMLFSVVASLYAGGLVMASAMGWLLWGFMTFATLVSFGFLLIVLWTNAKMFLPEALSKHPVRSVKAKLEIRMAEREHAAMPFSYIVGSYSFAPYVAPEEVPLQIGREYIVYYTPRSRLLLSIAPSDQSESKQWLPQ